jgi:hypothetical protein
MNEANITREGLELVKNWLNAKRRAEDAARAASQAWADANDAAKALANWMAPQVIKPKPGEKIAIWCGDSLIQLEVGGITSGGEDGRPSHMSGDEITVRFRGKHFEELAR